MKASKDQGERVLRNALHAIRSLLCTATNHAQKNVCVSSLSNLKNRHAILAFRPKYDRIVAEVR